MDTTMMEDDKITTLDNVVTREISKSEKSYEYLSWSGDFCQASPINYLQINPPSSQSLLRQNMEREKTEFEKQTWAKRTFGINKTLVPLKLTLFFFSAAAFSILPYLTIHMKDIGISVEHIALMYAILPFTIFMAPPLVGYLADKIGSYTKVLMLSLLGSGVFHTVLLFLPSIIEVTRSPEAISFAYEGNTTQFQWQGCGYAFVEGHEELTVEGCALECPIDVGICEAVSNMFLCQANGTLVTFSKVNLTLSSSSDEELGEMCQSTSYAHLLLSSGKPLELAPGCKLTCNNVIHVVATQTFVEGSRALTNSLYFLFRMLATICLACNFVLLHAQTIHMCKVEEDLGNRGALGRQYVYEALAQAIISPSVGKLMDYVSTDGRPNYYVPFFVQDIFIIFCIINVFFIKMKIDLPKSSGMKGVKKIFTSLDICFFLAVMFVLGNCFGFVETFLFLYLKDEMHAPMYLLGLTITTGAVISIPFLYISDWIVGKMGNENVFITAFAMYAIRYVGYSYISDPWMAFPFEALELFTYQLKKVAASKYIGENSPEGLLATLNGLAGGMHYGFGKGTGGLIGGAIIAATGSIAMAFRYFGVAAAVCGLIYFLYQYFYAGGFALFYRDALKEKNQTNTKEESGKEMVETKEPFLPNKDSPEA